MSNSEIKCSLFVFLRYKMRRMIKQYKSMFENLSSYWSIYGGFKSIMLSPYFHIAFVCALLVWPFWCNNESKWYDLPISVIPDVLGFTLAGYTVLMAFGNADFMKIICMKGADGSHSPFIDISAAFVHFIVMQIISLFYAVIAKGWECDNWFVSLIGTTIFLYALLVGVSAILIMFKLAKCYEILVNKNAERK